MKNTNGEVLRRMLKAADAGGYAVPMFNYTDLWDQSAAIEAALELRAPIMFASIPKTALALGGEGAGRHRMRTDGPVRPAAGASFGSRQFCGVMHAGH